MRTARVNPTTSSIFRNSRQYLQSNELVFKMMHDGSGQQSLGGRQESEQNKNKSKQTNRQVKNKVLKKMPNKLAVKGLQYDANSVVTMQNRLLKHSEKISMERNKQTRIHTYRTSI